MSDQLVKIIDLGTGQELYSCSLKELDQAYSRASEYESYGLDIKIDAPNITETLALSLGIDRETLERYRQSVTDEIHDHEGSCCASNGEKNQ